MPVHNVASYLGECLESVLGQRLRDLEVIAVDDGSTDGSPKILAEFAAQDPRLTVLHQANAGQGPARNLGVTRARGEFLTFLDADDTLPPTAYQHAVDTLRRTGSDFAVGEVQRVRNGVKSNPPWASSVHRHDRLGTTIDESPDALQDVIACNRVFRRAFWNEQVGGFEGRGAYEDHVPMVKAYVRASQFDLLKRVTYYWRIREDRTSTGQQKRMLQNLRDRVEVKAEAQELLEREASPAVFSTWLGRVLDLDLAPYVKHALAADEEYRAVLASAYRRHLAMATPAAWRQVRVFHKLRAWHVAQERWDLVELIEQYVRDYGRPPRTRVEGDKVLADLEIADQLDPDMPHVLWELAESETALDARLLRAWWDGPALLRIRGWAAVGAVDTTDREPHVRLTLQGPQKDARIDVPVVPVVEPRATAVVADPEANHDRSGFDAAIDVRELIADRAGPATWSLTVTVVVDGLVREGAFSGAVPGGSAATQSLSPTELDGMSVTPAWRPYEGFTLQVGSLPVLSPAGGHPTPLQVTQVALVDGGMEVTVEGGMLEEATSLRIVGSHASVAPVATTPGGTTTTLSFPTRAPAFAGPPLPLPEGSYTLDTPGSGDARPIGVAPALRGKLPLELADETLTVRLTYAKSGECRFTVMSGLGPRERSRWAKRQVVRRYGNDGDVTDQVLLHARAGTTAAGGPGAVARALSEVRPDLRQVWSIADRSVALPEGASGVVLGSQSWAREVARSRYVVADGPVDRLWPLHGRRWLITGGQPLMSAGRGRWLAEGFSERHMQTEVARFGRWELVTVPSELAAVAVTSDLGYEGRIVVVGDPATDPVVAPDSAQTRAQARDALALPPDAFVVLYAPADRPRMATGTHSARITRELDLALLRSSLGSRAIILVRGGEAVARGSERVRGIDGIIDVTDHPDEAALVLAADAAVLDYTPLRFTWALTGKPAVFHLPDLGEYLSHRPPLLSLHETATGPVVTSTEEVVRALSDVDALRDAFASHIRDVNSIYSPLADGRAAERAAAALLADR